MLKYFNSQATGAAGLAGSSALLTMNLLNGGPALFSVLLGALIACSITIFAQMGVELSQAIEERAAWLRTLRDALRLLPILRRQSAALEDFAELISESEGVVGLHTEGDVVPWSDLLIGGKDETWLGNYSKWVEGIVEDAPDAKTS